MLLQPAPRQSGAATSTSLQKAAKKVSYSHMSGIPFDTPAARFLRRSNLLQRAMLGIALVVDHWLTCAGCLSKNCRQNEAEFPAARTANKLRTLRRSPAADGASFDALRPNHNWINIKDQYEISFIREKFAAFARRVPKERRRSLASSTCRAETAREKVALAKNYGCTFRKRKNETVPWAEWLAATATTAAARA